MQKRSEFILSLQESHSNYTATICLHSQPTITEKINKIREKDKKIIMNITSSGFVVNTVGFTWHHVALHIYGYIVPIFYIKRSCLGFWKKLPIKCISD